jgi:putative nucleotidyltransferase with HDIG domain
MSKIDENGTTFDSESEDKLNLVLDTTYPLLIRFRETCPGTYKHSQALAAMLEGISLSLGLDVTLMRVAATYHDIGKMFNAKYFTENQLDDENPHDKLDPRISYEIVTRHVSDSAVILLGDSNFPRRVIEMISQHHGQTVLKSFFNKAGQDIEDIFRYKTNKPVSIEAAALMICDVVEAMSRSMLQVNKFDPQVIIEDTINGLLDDGQLDFVVMRLGDLKKIKMALAKELEGMYQKRVDYTNNKKEII